MKKKYPQKAHPKHNLHKHPLYKVFHSMKSRCYKENNRQYKNYGGRGITVCEEWKNDFLTFYNWAIEAGWKKGLTIDRIDNDGNYCPENCRIATQKQQAANKRTNNLVTINGETLCLREMCKKLGIEVSSVYYRLSKGWTMERALSEPFESSNWHKNFTDEELKKKMNTVYINGQLMKITDAAKLIGLVDPIVARARVNSGWHPFDALTWTASKPLNLKREAIKSILRGGLKRYLSRIS